MGDTAAHCGVMTVTGPDVPTGAGGLEYTVFAGTPTLALVAHELANAETQNDAVPSLLSQVAAAAGGTTWSPTDGVASCLVAHFMGFQDAVPALGNVQPPSPQPSPPISILRPDGVVAPLGTARAAQSGCAGAWGGKSSRLPSLSHSATHPLGRRQRLVRGRDRGRNAG